MATSEASKGTCKAPDSYSTCRLGGVDFWNQGVEGLVQGGHSHTSPDAAAPREWGLLSLQGGRQDVCTQLCQEKLYLRGPLFTQQTLNACALFSFVTTNCSITRRSAPVHTQSAHGRLVLSQLRAPPLHLSQTLGNRKPDTQSTRERKKLTFLLLSLSFFKTFPISWVCARQKEKGK